MLKKKCLRLDKIDLDVEARAHISDHTYTNVKFKKIRNDHR